MVELLEIHSTTACDGSPAREITFAILDETYAVTVAQHADGNWEAIDVEPRPETATDAALLRAEALAVVD